MALSATWFIIAMNIKFTLNLKSNIVSVQDSKLQRDNHEQGGNGQLHSLNDISPHASE